MNRNYKVSETLLLGLKDLVESYRILLLQTNEEDEFMDELRLSRIDDCNIAIEHIKAIQGRN